MPSSTVEKPLMTTKETADYLCTSQNALDARRSRGQGPPYVRMGRKVLYRKVEVDKWLDTQRE